jgi:thioredoxin reductase (NADPH)
VSYCAVCDGFFYRGKTEVVVGGGDSAAEEALYLAKIAKKVYMVHRRAELRAGMILQKRIKAEANIEMVWNTVPVAILADNAGVTGIALAPVDSGEQRELDTDGVFIFVGFSPNNQLVPAGTRTNADGYVVTDEKCQTSFAGIYAVGDLREKYARQIVTAAADGCVAALAAARYVDEKRGEKRSRNIPISNQK